MSPLTKEAPRKSRGDDSNSGLRSEFYHQPPLWHRAAQRAVDRAKEQTGVQETLKEIKRWSSRMEKPLSTIPSGIGIDTEASTPVFSQIPNHTHPEYNAAKPASFPHAKHTTVNLLPGSYMTDQNPQRAPSQCKLWWSQQRALS